MKILHTSDWHIGRALYGRKRYEEQEAFLDWLAGTIEKEQVDILLVAGDIFDNSVPSNRAQEMYYRFLCRVSNSQCRHVAVIAGNHDSPSFLDAPRELLRFLDVHVVGGVSENLEDEVLALKDGDGKVELILCAVPYLRDRDVRSSEALESVEEKEQKLVEGITAHYKTVLKTAEKQRDELEQPVPIVAMGHLFAAGGETVEGDGVRNLYVGSLARVGKDAFPDIIDYLALGHLHAPQKVAGTDNMRYCGSPIALGFAEAQKEKVVCLVEFQDGKARVSEIPVPRFRELQVIEGDLVAVSKELEKLKKTGTEAWLEIDYKGDEIPGNLRKNLDQVVDGTGIEILRVKNDRVLQRTMGSGEEIELLENLDLDNVFERCLEAHGVPGEQREDLTAAYREIITEIQEADSNKE